MTGDVPASGDEPLVSVIVPAWNCEATLADALASVAGQTHPNIEIIVVDDGSTDRSADIAREFCAGEPRARLLRKDNGGVASARNLAIEQAQGEFIAPIDSDDLWHPEKLSRQLAVFERAPASVGLVYNWFRKIDERARVIEPPFCPRLEGRVLRTHLQWNFIGNGSTPLLRASALDGLRYNSDLRAAGNQGCEDYLLQLQLASRFEFACAPAFLTGYRASPANMSSDSGQMIRSHVQMYRILRGTVPPAEEATIQRQLARNLAALGLLELRHGKLGPGFAALASAAEASPGHALSESVSRATRRFLPAVRRSHPLIGRPFRDLAPEDGAAV